MISADTRICAILKADAYGHGASIVADALCNFAVDEADPPLVDQLAVASIEEAALLPEVSVPVLILHPVENAFTGDARSAIELAVQSKWILTIDTPAAADDVARIAMSLGGRALVNVMLDTGMTRGGCPVEQLPALLARIESHASLRMVNLGTHMANADRAGDPLTLKQLADFRGATDDFAFAHGMKIRRHAGSSGAIAFTPAAHFQMVRPGIALYGIDPIGRPCMDRAFKPVMKWTAPLIGVRDAPAGTGVGYGQTFAAPRDMRVGLVPVGYADGYWRSFSNRADVLVGRIPCPVIGRVSMDLTTIDLTRAPHAVIGDEVTLLDNDPLSPASVYHLARLADTIPYEILSRIGPRIPRIAVDPADEVQASGRDGVRQAYEI
jgi:alanine racemase